MESHLRSILKGVSWRVGGTTVTIVVAWILTKNINLSAKIGLIETVLKIGVFYVHERIWIRLNIGKKEPVDYQI
jgi:adenylylsulfate kinase